MERVRPGSRNRSPTAGRHGPRRGCSRIRTPPSRKTGQPMAAIAEVPGDGRRCAVAAVPVVPSGAAKKGQRQEEGHWWVAAPQIAGVPAPRILPRSGPAIGIDRVPRREQVAHLEVDVRTGGVAGAAAQRDQLAARDVLALIDEELIVVEIGRAVGGMIDDYTPSSAIAPLAVDHGAVIGGHHWGVRGYGVVRTPMAVVRVGCGPVEA